MTDPPPWRPDAGFPAGTYALRPAAVEGWLPIARGELRRLVEQALCHPGAPIDPRALVAAAASQLGRAGTLAPESQHSFRAAAGIALRHILVGCAERGGVLLPDAPAVRVPELTMLTTSRVLVIDAGLAELAASHPRAAAVAEVRLFGAASLDEIALGLEWPLAEVTRDWAFAKAWLWLRMTGRAGA